MDSIMGTKKKKKAEKKTELIQIRFEVAKPGSKKYTHLDWEELLKSHGKEKDEEALRRFYDEDTLNMHKKLGEMKTKSGKSLKVDLEYLLHMNRNAGYDMDDEFIDDSEAVDDQNFSSKKGGFYVGKGDVKAMDEEEEEEESEDEEEEIQKKPRKKNKEKTSTTAQESSSDSDSSREPVRMTGAPPTARMTGAPPSRKLLVKRPSPPVPTPRKEQTPPESFDEPPAKKKALEPVASTSTSSDIQVIPASESPTKALMKTPSVTVKKAIPPVTTATSSPAAPSTSSTPSTSTGSSPKDKDSRDNITAIITNRFTALSKRGKEFQMNKEKVLDRETIEHMKEFFLIPQHHKIDKFNIENLLGTVAGLFGLSVTELNRLLSTTPVTPPAVNLKKESSESADWKLSASDLPHMSEADIANVTTIVKSWKSNKQLPNSVLTGWLKDVNQGKLNVDQARNKLYEYVRVLPELDKAGVPDVNMDLPKHERSRKARMFLHQWVWLSRKYVEMILPTIKKPTTEGYAKKQLLAANTLREALKKQQASFELKKDKPSDAVYQFQFTEPVLAAISTYLDELVDYSLSIGKLDIIVHGIDSLHQSLDNKITLIQFYIELCRRLQKLSFLTVEEPMRTRLANAKEHISKHQVVQNVKYMIKWPGGTEPSLRGLNRELHSFETSVLANWKPAAAAPVIRTPSNASSSTPSTSKATSSTSSSTSSKPTPSSSATRQPTDEERRAMNQIVQAADICDPTVVPMSDELLIAMVTAVYACGVPLMNQMVMLKNVLAHVGQGRMAQAIAGQKTEDMTRLVTKQYQALFDYFSKYEKAMDQKRLKEKDVEEKERKKMEERLKKERERMMEKERKEQEKREEREKKEKERREEKERKEKEIRETIERRRKEEEDRKMAQQRLLRQMEDERRKREAEQAVEKEMERRARMETEAASALQGLEEDNLMDDVDFVAEQQSREDQERKIAEAKRAVERENQIRMMRAQKEKHEPSEPFPPRQELPQVPQNHRIEPTIPSNFQQRQEPPQVPVQKQISQIPPIQQVEPSHLSHFQPRHEAPPAPHQLIQQQMPQNQQVQTSSLSHFPPRHVQPQMPQNQQVTEPIPQVPHSQPVVQNGNFPAQRTENAPQYQVKREQIDSFDILNVAQQTAGLSPMATSNTHPHIKSEPVNHESVHSPIPPAPGGPSERKGGAFDKLASLRGRTMSADVKRLSENGGKETVVPPLHHQNFPTQQQQQNMFNGSNPTTPYSAPSTSQHFFPSNNNHNNNQMGSAHEQLMLQQQQQQMRLRQQQEMQMQQRQMQMAQMAQQQQQRMQQNAMGSGMFFGGELEQQREQRTGRSMSISQGVPAQQVPASYQSPSHHNSISNSSLMHTPLSNGSMVPQSPQFSSHPSPMSQQFHTPPSAGMLNGHQMINSPVQPQQQHLQHFNYQPQPQQPQNYQQQQQMQRLLNQQQHQHQMQQQQAHSLMRQMSQHQHNYPPH